ncbi:MAG: hypothetical protein IT288_17665 [Bdellovibrionales bacterium]|nr:hypothetical protein [Bdellovibrionales bacterium]
MKQDLYSFFLVTAPGLEELALEEWRVKSQFLRELYPQLMSPEQDACARTVIGGVELFLKEAEGWTLNHYLRLPTRILQRLTTFQCNNYERLEAKVRHLEWHQYLRQGEIEVHPSYHKSYINRKKGIEECVLKGIDHCQKHQALRKAHLNEPQSLFVRFFNNECTISLDTSGHLLHRRGYKTLTVEAPLRETLASALYFMCYLELGEVPQQIFDPMAGSGTLVFEPLHFWQVWRRRSYAYQNFPCAPKVLVTEPTQSLPLSTTRPAVLAGDLDPKAVEALRGNFAALVKKEKFAGEFREGDWNEVWNETELGAGSILVINPPYNKRLATDMASLPRQLNRMIEKFHPTIFATVWPGRQLPDLKGTWVRQISTTNGGVPVTLGVLRPTVGDHSISRTNLAPEFPEHN